MILRVSLPTKMILWYELAPKKIDKADAKQKVGSAGFAYCCVSLKLSVAPYGADALSQRPLPGPSERQSVREGLGPSFSHRIVFVLFIQYYTNLGKCCEGRWKALGEEELSRNYVSLDNLQEYLEGAAQAAERRTGEPCSPRKRDGFPELWVFILPSRGCFSGYHGNISLSLPVRLCCRVVEETTKPAKRTLILGCWFVCLVLESAMKIWGRLRKNKAKIFLGKKKKKPDFRNTHCFITRWRGRSEHVDSPHHHLRERLLCLSLEDKWSHKKTLGKVSGAPRPWK